MQPGQKVILFDFDGVLVDTFAVCFAGNLLIDPQITEKEFKSWFMGNVNEAVKKLYPDNKVETDNKFFSYYNPRLMELPLYPGMSDVIPELALKYSLMIVSSTISSPIYEYLDARDMAEYFEEIMGNDVDESKLAKIQMITAKYGIEPTDCVFITDTLGDIKEAKDADVGTLAVTWGFHDRETLAKGMPAGFINRPDEIADIIDGYFE